MGEEVVSSGEAMDLELEEKAKKTKDEGGSASVVRWERFLPRMVLRVLLVEADDSTRQIIAALLRKCSFRVAAVSDGLKAWELLKGKPHNVDLILTEVELPSISGFALLTLIGEHEICKNIPVIMMSSNDSVSTVYKCMLRGAADFLVKPVRKNELRNLWQHVWRRQASASGGNGPQDESVAQQKVEATAENNESNDASNHSSGFMACIQRNRECIEKGSDAQSSCTKPELEAEKEGPDNVHNLSQSTQSKSPVTDMEIQKHEQCDQSSRKLPMDDCEERGCVAAACADGKAMIQGDDKASDREHGNITGEACFNNHAPVNSSGEAIDLIGAFDNIPKCGYRNSFSDNGPSKVDSSPFLDLTLRRSHPSGSVNQVSDGRPTLNHSDASAFSRYINKTVLPPHSSATMCNPQRDYRTNTEKQFSNHPPNSYPNGLSLSSQKNVLSLATGQSGQAESAFPCPPQKVFPVPVKGIRFDSLCNPFGSLVPQLFCAQSGQEQLSFQVDAFHSSNLETRNSQQLHNPVPRNGAACTNKTELQERQKFESSDDWRYFSSATDQSASSSFCNGTTASRLNSIGCGSNGNFDQVPVVRATAGSGNGEGLPTNDSPCHRSVQREAALYKFRLKRKDRCFDKKVRYESRKKLAEQRPRVKGQFVRHAQNEPLPVETNGQ
ncbi:hypothetical protein Vadar_005006 [Vaccinium darrowii]|uniref:Uncharacterized protein n=1 Tax=Vaccinium darrowii TaxID=229202 RepID=A0ACB7XFF0_9ERIC|nr:hypothetical protein Vadar_005006 [Vaccinium darrowii]